MGGGRAEKIEEQATSEEVQITNVVHFLQRLALERKERTEAGGENGYKESCILHK